MRLRLSREATEEAMTRLSWRLQSFRTMPINWGRDLFRSRQHRLDRIRGAGQIPTQHQPVAIGPAHPLPVASVLARRAVPFDLSERTPERRALVIAIKRRLYNRRRRNQRLELISPGVVRRPVRCTRKVRIAGSRELGPVPNHRVGELLLIGRERIESGESHIKIK